MTTTANIALRLRLARPDFVLDVALELPGRSITALFGPSGSGKTSCLRAMAGLERATAGQVRVLGEVWQDDDARIWVPPHRRALGYVFQEASLFAHLSVRGNLVYGLKRVPPAQRRFALDQAVDLLGIGSLMDRSPATLSGGERQRVAIARALATSPRLLLLDEPLAALDAARKQDILPWLEKLRDELDIPVIYVSHALDEVARLADHLVLLEAGRAVASGPAADLMTRLDLSLAHGDAAGAVITATVASHDPAYHLTQARFAGGDFNIPLQAAAVGQPVRIRVQARDVSLTLARQSGTSIQNILPVAITALSPDSPGQVMVRLDAGGSALLARVTAKSAHALKLEVGQRLFAQVKGVAILG